MGKGKKEKKLEGNKKATLLGRLQKPPAHHVNIVNDQIIDLYHCVYRFIKKMTSHISNFGPDASVTFALTWPVFFFFFFWRHMPLALNALGWTGCGL